MPSIIVMILQGDAQQDVEVAECVSGRVCAWVCGCVCVCVWVGEIDELRECVAKRNKLFDEIGELACVWVFVVCAWVRARASAHGAGGG